MPKPRLVTIGPSHYCEKARWALQRAGLEFVEEAHIPGLHYASSLLRHGQRTTPILVTPHGKVRDSTDILRHADKLVDAAHRLFPGTEAEKGEVERLEEYFDQKLGPATRLLVYYHTLRDRERFRRVVEARVSVVERAAFRLTEAGIVKFLTRGLGIDADRAKKSDARISEVFDEVDRRLERGARYLVGDRMTAADLAFAALAAPVLLPPEYGWPLPPIDDLKPAQREIVDRYRSRPAGAFALELYRSERRRAHVQSRTHRDLS